MSRTLTAVETKVVALDEYSVFTRVKIKDSGGTFQDYTTLAGFNWIESVDYGADVDEFVSSASVTLRLDHHQLSLAPLFASGKLATYIDVGREIKVETATLPFGATPVDADYRLVFHGYIDETDSPVDAADASLKLGCRDLGAVLQDTLIEQDGRPGSPATLYAPTVDRDVEDIMQDILDDWDTTGTTLYVPSSPSWALIGGSTGPTYGFRPGRVGILEALNNLAYMIGWVVRYKFDAGSGTFKLTFYEPDRANTTPNITLASNQIVRVNRMARSQIGVRNKAIGTYYSDPGNVNTSTPVTVSDATSITRYGLRTMLIDEAKTSPINTTGEMTALLTAAVSDLKDVKADGEIELRYRYDVQLEDLLRLSTATRVYDANTDIAVVAVRHRLSARSNKTTVEVRASTPVGAYKGWWNKGLDDVLSPNIEDAQPGAFTLVATSRVLGVILTVSDAPQRTRLYGGIEFHISTTNGFTPGPSTLKEVSLTNRVEIGGLTHGTTYYAKAIVVRASGLKSPTSNQETFTIGRVGALDYEDASITAAAIADELFPIYGDGTDGAYLLDGTAAGSGMTKSGSIYTMIRDIHATDVTFATGFTLDQNGFGLWINGTETLAGSCVIHADGTAGSDAVGQTAGGAASAGASGSLYTGGAGASGGSGGAETAVGTAGGGGGSLTLTPMGNGPSGGVGGMGSNNTVAGGGFGSGGTGTAANCTPHSLQEAFTLYDRTSNGGVRPGCGGGGGGGGGGGTVGSGNTGGGGGGAGAGGKCLQHFAKTLVLSSWTGRISTNGGAGGNGAAGGQTGLAATWGGGGGGGSGGNGGINVMCYRSISGGTLVAGTNVTAAGGAAGAKGGTTGTGLTNGNAGATGLVLLFQS